MQPALYSKINNNNHSNPKELTSKKPNHQSPFMSCYAAAKVTEHPKNDIAKFVIFFPFFATT